MKTRSGKWTLTSEDELKITGVDDYCDGCSFLGRIAISAGWTLPNGFSPRSYARSAPRQIMRKLHGNAAEDGMRRPALPYGMLLSSQWKNAL